MKTFLTAAKLCSSAKCWNMSMIMQSNQKLIYTLYAGKVFASNIVCIGLTCRPGFDFNGNPYTEKTQILEIITIFDAT